MPAASATTSAPEPAAHVSTATSVFAASSASRSEQLPSLAMLSTVVVTVIVVALASNAMNVDAISR